jgi:hypothetical protein
VAPNKVTTKGIRFMSTKSSPKKPGAKAQAKPAQAPSKLNEKANEKKKTGGAGSKLATLVSVKDSVKNAIFGSGRNAPKAKQLEKTSPPKTLATSAKTSMKATPSKSKTPPPSKAAKAPAPVKAAPVKAAAPAKAGKAAAPVKAGKAAAAATPPPAPVSVKGATKGVKGKAAAPAATPATPAPTPKGKAGKTPVSPLLKASLSKTRSSRLHPDDVCRETACESLATTLSYCRLHYIKNWKKIKRKEIILKEGKLNQYIEELVVKYPDKYIEAIRQDLASDKDFAQVIVDLDLDESADDFEADGENAEGLIDNIKGNFDDEGDAF